MPWLAPIGTPADSGAHREPGADLAIHPRVEIAGVCLHPRQRLRQHRKSLHRLGVGIGMGLARAQAFDAMVDGADAGRQKQPFGRVHGKGGIEDRGARHHQLMAQHFLDLGARVGDAGDGTEFAAGNRRRHADLAHRRRVHRRRDAFVGSNSLDILDRANVIGEAELHGLGAVGDRAAAYRHDKIGIGCAGLLGGGNDGLSRRVRRHRIEGRHATRA